MKPVLTASGMTLLKLRSDEPLSNFAFKFNLRRYILVAPVLREVGRCRLTLWNPS
jgi:hypothetical protein